jgi:hypothetical protein
MIEIETYRSFRAGVAGPSSAVRDAARARLVAATASGRARLSRPGPVSRRFGVTLAAGAAVAASVFLVASLVDGGAGVLERAEAAIDPQGRVLHVVVHIEARDGSVTRSESWVRPDGSGRSVDLSGSGPGDCLAGETMLRCFDVATNVVDVYRYNPEAVEAGRRNADLPGFRVDQPQSIHRAFGEGYARLIGKTSIAGRPVYEIRLATPFIEESGKATPRFDDAVDPILFVDRETYQPVAERFPDAGSTTTYETYEFLADDAAPRQLFEFPTNSETRVVVHPVGEGPQG